MFTTQMLIQSDIKCICLLMFHGWLRLDINKLNQVLIRTANFIRTDTTIHVDST